MPSRESPLAVLGREHDIVFGIPPRISFELLPLGCVAFDIRQTISKDRDADKSASGAGLALTPAPALLQAARAMFKDAWEHRLNGAKPQRKALETQIRDVSTQSDKLLTRIMDTDNDRLIRRYEDKLAKLDMEKAILEEKRDSLGMPVASYEESLEHALRFLANPCKAWNKSSFTLRRTILKLVLTEPFHYHRSRALER